MPSRADRWIQRAWMEQRRASTNSNELEVGGRAQPQLGWTSSRITFLPAQAKRLAAVCAGAGVGSCYPGQAPQRWARAIRPRNWPAGSALATTIQVALVAGVLVATGCRERPNEQTKASEAPRPGGEVVASLRSEPGNYNRYFEASAAADLVTMLTQARLVRINRASDALEPALAESWTSADGVTYRVKLRPNVRFSDGVPFSSADVVFSLQAVYGAPGSTLASGMRVGGQPLSAAAVDDTTVDITFPRAFAPAMRLLDNLPILPRHRLQGAYEAKAMKDAWTPSRPASDVAGLGPFVLAEHVSGQRLVFTRNPNYWRRDAN